DRRGRVALRIEEKAPQRGDHALPGGGLLARPIRRERPSAQRVRDFGRSVDAHALHQHAQLPYELAARSAWEGEMILDHAAPRGAGAAVQVIENALGIEVRVRATGAFHRFFSAFAATVR